ncbi:hydroxymethylbilane synthase [Ferroplasma sp.]|uniref:hydroxymethylbilane synthase n=1 Tax=Ferroplasma sp. TaxID=2591003 RepID=UPI00307F4903
MPLIIGTRNSKLALIQANTVKNALENRGYKVEIKGFTSAGDANRSIPLYRMSSTGVFVDELNARILGGEIDLAVHSAKDIPSNIQEGLEITSTIKRDDFRDVLISEIPFKEMEEGYIIGTSSMRRIRQAKTLNSKITVSDIRGNIDSRILKYTEKKYNGIIIAMAAYNRMALNIKHFILPEDQFLPAPNQGIIAIVGKKGSKPSAISKEINHNETYKDMKNERFISTSLNLGCSMPVGILSLNGKIRARFYSLKSDSYKDMEFNTDNLESAVNEIMEEIKYYGYF